MCGEKAVCVKELCVCEGCLGKMSKVYVKAQCVKVLLVTELHVTGIWARKRFTKKGCASTMELGVVSASWAMSLSATGALRMQVVASFHFASRKTFSA